MKLELPKNQTRNTIEENTRFTTVQRVNMKRMEYNHTQNFPETKYETQENETMMIGIINQQRETLKKRNTTEYLSAERETERKVPRTSE